MSDIAWKVSGSPADTLQFWWLDKGAQLIGGVRSIQLPSAADQTLLGVADVSGDGIGDVVFRDTRAGYLLVWEMALDVTEISLQSAAPVAQGFSFQGFGSFD
jgi:hypothetical protein